MDTCFNQNHEEQSDPSLPVAELSRLISIKLDRLKRDKVFTQVEEVFIITSVNYLLTTLGEHPARFEPLVSGMLEMYTHPGTMD